MKKSLSASVSLLALAILTMIPVGASAQSASSTNWRQRMQDSSEGSGTDTAIHEAEISNWRNRSSGAQSAISALGSDRVESIPIPVLFGIARSDITPNFGDPRDGGARSHEGEDLISKTGIPIVSPTDAVVTSTGYGASSGYYVYTANPGGETFAYMHLTAQSALVRGASVKRGDLIGYVGNTGNASGGVSHLHFEIRKDGATDPYPRLTGSFTGEEKIRFLDVILAGNSDPQALANLLVGYYPQEFKDIRSQGVTLPSQIETALANAPLGGGASSDLKIGASGSSVGLLQNYLIGANKGPKAQLLANAGATGNFGAITQAALIEFQQSVGLTADGIYGVNTRTYIAAHPNPTSGSSSSSGSNSDPFDAPNSADTGATTCVGYGCPKVPVGGYVGGSASGSSLPAGDLGSGSKGSAVVWLQNFLIAQNKGTSARTLAGAGATGNFGPITQNALIEYQASIGISPASGYFGPITRAYLKAHGLL